MYSAVMVSWSPTACSFGTNRGVVNSSGTRSVIDHWHSAACRVLAGVRFDGAIKIYYNDNNNNNNSAPGKYRERAQPSAAAAAAVVVHSSLRRVQLLRYYYLNIIVGCAARARGGGSKRGTNVQDL